MDRSAEENSESIKSKREEVDAGEFFIFSFLDSRTDSFLIIAKNVKKMLFVEVQKLRGTLENWNSENVSLREQVDAKCAEGLTLAVLEDELNLNKARRDGLPQVEKSVIDLHKKRLLEVSFFFAFLWDDTDLDNRLRRKRRKYRMLLLNY